MLADTFARVMRRSLAPGACLVAVMVVTTSGARAASGGLPGTGGAAFNPAGDSEDNHCVSPEGVDANQLLGISEYLVTPDACDTVPTGEFYVPFTSSTWTMSPTWAAYPADYTPSAPTPAEDFASKVVSATYTVDPGTVHEHAYRYDAADIMELRNIGDFFPISAPDIPVALFLAKLPPLPPGAHRYAFAIEMSARHCDGSGTGPEHCLDAGTTNLGSCPFTVVPRHELAARP